MVLIVLGLQPSAPMQGELWGLIPSYPRDSWSVLGTSGFQSRPVEGLKRA